MSFDLNDINSAHSKVRSGADFPAYVRALYALGVKQYHVYVADGHAEYTGDDNDPMVSPPLYALKQIATDSNEQQLRIDLLSHQRGETDYPTFCNHAAASGVYKWTVDVDQMTCTYFNASGAGLLVEKIPVA